MSDSDNEGSVSCGALDRNSPSTGWPTTFEPLLAWQFPTTKTKSSNVI